MHTSTRSLSSSEHHIVAARSSTGILHGTGALVLSKLTIQQPRPALSQKQRVQLMATVREDWERLRSKLFKDIVTSFRNELEELLRAQTDHNV